MYSVEEFIYDDGVKKYVRRTLKKYRDEFKPESRKVYIPSDFGMMLGGVPLLEELKFYYNNDLCLSVATSMAMVSGTDFNLRTHAYHLENAVSRIANTWEYIHIALNRVLDMEMIVGEDLRNQIIDAKCSNIEFVKDKNGYRPVIMPISDDEIMKIKPELEKKYKLLATSINLRKSRFHKTLKEKYTITDDIQRLKELFQCEEVRRIIELRNESAHRRSLGARYSVAPIDFMPSQGISINPKGWYDFADIGGILEKNLAICREALHILVKMVFYSERPNQKENEGKRFFVYNIYCNNCTKNFALPDFTVEFMQERNEKLVCPLCSGTDTVVRDKTEVNDQYFWNILYKYSDFLFKYWNKAGIEAKY